MQSEQFLYEDPIKSNSGYDRTIDFLALLYLHNLPNTGLA